MNFTIPFRSQLVQPEPPVGEDNEDTDTEEEDDQSVILLDETLLERPQLQEEEVGDTDSPCDLAALSAVFS